MQHSTLAHACNGDVELLFAVAAQHRVSCGASYLRASEQESPPEMLIAKINTHLILIEFLSWAGKPEPLCLSSCRDTVGQTDKQTSRPGQMNQ